MFRFKLLSGFRMTEFLFCFMLIAALITWSVGSYQAYTVNATMLNPFYQLHGAKIDMSIDNAYKGNFSNSVNYQQRENLYHVGHYEADASPQGHLKARFSEDNHYISSNAGSINKTLVLLRNNNTQGGYQFNAWRCPDNPSLGLFSITDPIDDATLDLRYIYFICHGS